MKLLYTPIIVGFVLIAGIGAYSRCTDLFGAYDDDRRKQKRRQSNEQQRPAALDESFFVMSNTEQCHRANQHRDRAIANCPSPYCRGKLARRLIQHIDEAKHLLCMCLYQISLDYMADALTRAQRRGVIVRLITDKTMICSSNSQIQKLERAGVGVRIAGDGEKLMHNKFCLIDVLSNETKFPDNQHPHGGLLINGSLNWTTNAVLRNYENVMITSSETHKEAYKRAFDHIWASLLKPPK